jgi:hypothetical protein
MDPRACLISCSKYLTEFEKTEILDFETIYWIPMTENRKHTSQANQGANNNNGFDNDKQEYITDEGEHISYRFEI